MNQMVVRTTAIILPLIFAGFLLGAGESAPTTTVAQNKAKELFELACGGCHAVDLATSLRNSKEQWSEIVQSMIDKGAYIKKDEVATIVDYLTANYGLKQETPAPKEAPAAGGGTNPAASKDAEIQQLAEGACGGCHGYDLVSEKRGSKSDWNDTVTRMVERGADLKADQVPTVVDFLARKYPIQ